MITVKELKGVMAMMPAFTTSDGSSPSAKDTVNTMELERAVDQIIRDGVDVVTTMGSFGECHTLLWNEKKKLIEATIGVAKKRVPVFIGCTSLNTRETMEQVEFAQQAGADGVLCGVPFIFLRRRIMRCNFISISPTLFPSLASRSTTTRNCIGSRFPSPLSRSL